jgi:hypothetical protein
LPALRTAEALRPGIESWWSPHQWRLNALYPFNATLSLVRTSMSVVHAHHLTTPRSSVESLAELLRHVGSPADRDAGARRAIRVEPLTR